MRSKKEFSVENTGSENLSFSIKLEDVTSNYIRTEDWTYTVTQDGNQIANGVLPAQNSYIVNAVDIDSGATNNFVLTVSYANSEEDQSVDMGKSLSFKVNIADAIITFKNAKEGSLLAAIADNNLISDPLAQIGIEELSKTNTGTYEVSPMESAVVSDGYGAWKYASTKEELESGGGTYVSTCNDMVNKYVMDFHTGKFEGIVYVESCTSDGIPMINQEVIKYETTLSMAEDDYTATTGNPSYYFRGNVKNNYVNYSGMCWQVVRILGNGTIDSPYVII